MNEQEYRDFYDRVGQSNGWDFSKLKCRVEGEAADLYGEVKKHCKRSDLWLDIGMGGGEAILAMREAALLLVGIDLSAGMVQTAESNLRESGALNVRFMQMDAENLDFPKRFFDVVSCRHSGFSAIQVAKVLSWGGVFLTQQVSEGDKSNLKQAFGRGQSYGDADGKLMRKYVQDLSAAGFTEIQALEYDSTEYYQTPEDLIFLLKHTPIIPGFGHAREDFEILSAFIDQNRSDRGIRTNSKRFIIKANREENGGEMR
ncbi:class I SAM-dependent methyltransferase [Cohnella herbarum]|uniref:Methyltransferase domain-containing protein n=1 Tax=Cohnella herbarum TaxID=2728023 RepID=A0A7Z2ZPI7_9BACL|nr:class I SAM-dependent methyltransferase [Cohnella herbarum]QJD86032.1 methyltransferase domain-containing protein [Cohnella herbarum]